MSPIVLLLILTIAKLKVDSLTIERKVADYFASAPVKLFHDVWQWYREPMEGAVRKSLQETLGSPGGIINVYVKQETKQHKPRRGFYFTDNIVNVILQNLFLREFPRLESPDVSFPLEHNVIRIESRVSKIFADADYVLFRNRSDIVYEGPQSVLWNSPFSFQQVQTSGNLTIIGEDCHLVGQAVVTMSGVSLHVGHSTFKLHNCKFSIEIYQPGSTSPPVIAPYFTKYQCLQLEQIFSNPIDDEMHTVLESILISHFNTTALFSTNMPKFRRQQKYIFQDVADFMSLVTRQLNKDILVQNQGVATMEGTELTWDDALFDADTNSVSSVSISDVTVNGLERLYYSSQGGPILTGEPAISDELRFALLQVRGKLFFKNSSTTSAYDFSADIKGLLVCVKIELHNDPGDNNNGGRRKGKDNEEDNDSHSMRSTDDSRDEITDIRKDDINSDNKDESGDDHSQTPVIGRSRTVSKFKIKGWRSLEFTAVDKTIYLQAGIPSYAFITGYLVNELPATILKHLDDQFSQAVEQAEIYRGTVNYEILKKRKIQKSPKQTKGKAQPYAFGKTTQNARQKTKKAIQTTVKYKITKKSPNSRIGKAKPNKVGKTTKNARQTTKKLFKQRLNIKQRRNIQQNSTVGKTKPWNRLH